MDHSDLKLDDGRIAKYDENLKAYTLTVDYSDHDVEIVMFGFEGNSDTREALKYTYANLMRDLRGYEEKALNELCRKIDAVVNKDEEEKVDSDAIRMGYFLSMVTIIDDDRVGIIEKANTGVEFMFEVKNPEDLESQLTTIAAEGTLEDGFDMFYLNGMPILDNSIYTPHELSTGDVVTYDPGVETYTGDIMIGDYEVECYFELNPDNSSADNAFELFEKIYRNAEHFDIQAKGLITGSVINHMDDIRKTLELPDLTLEDLMDQMMLDIAVFGGEFDMEFAYFFAGENKVLKATVTGTYTMGFNRYMIEYLDDDEF